MVADDGRRFGGARIVHTEYEARHWSRGIAHVAGIDEVGRGCLAGPVVAAAVVFSPDLQLISGVRDSKQLSPKRREQLFQMIADAAVDYGIGVVDSSVIDAINILQAARQAMRIAVEQLAERPGHLLIDGREVVDLPIPQTAIVKGDQSCFSIAAASILAKVTRDRMMVALETTYPGYSFARHKGYGTAQHLAALRLHGPTPIHRRSFAPVRELVGRAEASCYTPS